MLARCGRGAKERWSGVEDCGRLAMPRVRACAPCSGSGDARPDHLIQVPEFDAAPSQLPGGRRMRSSFRLPSECASDFSRGGHRTIGISRCGFLLGDGTASGLVRCVAVARVGQGLFAFTASGVLRRRRTGIEWRMLLTSLRLVGSRFPVADAGVSRTLARGRRFFGRVHSECLGQRVHGRLVRVHPPRELG
jgi:hypothetical protein